MGTEMNCKRCLHTGEKVPGRIANFSNDRLTGDVFAFCTDHADWATRLMAAAHKTAWAGGTCDWSVVEGLYTTLRTWYGKTDGAITVRVTGKKAVAARTMFA
jgi:hypothetical protein